jgi:hypothetical protein
MPRLQRLAGLNKSMAMLSRNTEAKKPGTDSWFSGF